MHKSSVVVIKEPDQRFQLRLEVEPTPEQHPRRLTKHAMVVICQEISNCIGNLYPLLSLYILLLLVGRSPKALPHIVSQAQLKITLKKDPLPK